MPIFIGYSTKIGFIYYAHFNSFGVPIGVPHKLNRGFGPLKRLANPLARKNITKMKQFKWERFFQIFGVVIAAVFVLIVAAAAYFTLFYGIRPGPSFINELQSGHIKKTEVTRFEILHFDRALDWPFRESDYSKMGRIVFTNRNDIEELLSILTTNSTSGTTQRNHPGTISWGIFRIELRTGTHFYLYYQAQKDWASGYFVSINANSANSTNPNGAKSYESTAIVDFLRRNDPVYAYWENVQADRQRVAQPQRRSPEQREQR